MAEIGLSVLAAGLGGQDEPDWARGISGEVERAISEGLKLSSTARVSVLISCIGAETSHSTPPLVLLL